MNLPLQVSFRNLEHSPSIEAKIREKAEGLEKFFDRITSCRVVVDAPEQHHRKGNLYHLRIELGVPGKEIVVSRQHHDDHSHEDVYVAIRDAFKAARRQLENYASKMNH